jgi:predicted alternative tryptophan synthase beta-subunit
VEITGKVLGVVGCGRIGQVVAASAANMGMQVRMILQCHSVYQLKRLHVMVQVIGYDPIMSASDFKEAGIKKVPTYIRTYIHTHMDNYFLMHILF